MTLVSGLNLRRCVVIFMFAVALLPPPCLDAQSKQPDAGTLEWHAAKAHAAGKTEVKLPWPQILDAKFNDLGDAFSKNTVVVAQLIDAKTIRNTHEIVTWRKYRVKEYLSKQPQVPSGTIPEEVPASLLPVAENEFLVPDLGGTVVINEVRVTQSEPGVPEFRSNELHLLFVLFRCSGQVALLNYGSDGILMVNSIGELQPVGNAATNRIWAELEKTKRHNVSSLRSWATERSK